MSAHARIEICRSIQPRADGGAADGELFKLGKRRLYHLARRFDESPPAGDLLRKPERHGILQMRAAYLYNIRVSRLQRRKGRSQRLARGYELFLKLGDGGDIHRRGVGVV